MSLFLEGQTGLVVDTSNINNFYNQASQGWVSVKINLDNADYDVDAYIDPTDKQLFLLFPDDGDFSKRLSITRESKSIKIGTSSKITFDASLSDPGKTNTFTLSPFTMSISVNEPDPGEVRPYLVDFIEKFVRDTATSGPMIGQYDSSGDLGVKLITQSRRFKNGDPLQFTGTTVYQMAQASSETTTTIRKSDSNKQDFIKKLRALFDGNGYVYSLLSSSRSNLDDAKNLTLYDEIMTWSDQFGAKTDVEGFQKSPGTAPGEEPKNDDLMRIVKKFTEEFDTKLDKKGMGDFEEGQTLNTELDGYTKGIRENSTEVSYNSTPVYERLGEKSSFNGTRNTYEGALGQKGLKEQLQDGLYQVTEDEPSIKTFLEMGKAGTLTDPGNARLYNNLKGFAKVMGVEEDFDRVSTGQPKPSGESEESGAKKEEGGEASEKKEEGGEEKKKKSKEEDEVKAEKPPQTGTAFYLKIINADKTEDAVVTLVNSDITEQRQLTYSVSGARLDDRLSVPINDNNREWFENAAKNKQTINVSVEAKPNTGGDRVTKKQPVLIRYPFPTAVAEIPRLEFVIGESQGLTVDTGLEADIGRGGAKDFRRRAGTVSDVFWTPSGGVSRAQVSVNVSAVGKDYTFEFIDNPLIVPVRISEAKKPELLGEGKKTQLREAATVPHWIFLKARPAETTGAGGAGRGQAPSGGIAVNVAVSRVEISTRKKYIITPNTGGNWVKGSFDCTIRPGSSSELSNMPNSAKKVMCLSDLRQAGVDIGDVENAIYEALFNKSEAWMRLGGAPCWAAHPSVSGGSGITRREITQGVGMVG